MIPFIHDHKVPQKRRCDIMYGSFVCSVCLKKDKPNRTRFTVGGDRINYLGEVATPTADMLVARILLNSIILMRGAWFMTIDDISNFYLMTPLKRPEYTRMKINDLPKEIVKEYKLRAMVNKPGMVYIKVTKKKVQLTSSGTSSKQAPRTRAQQTRLLPKQTGTRPLEAHHKTHFFHTCC